LKEKIVIDNNPESYRNSALRQEESLTSLKANSRAASNDILASCDDLKRILLEHTEIVSRSNPTNSLAIEERWIPQTLDDTHVGESYILRTLRFPTMNHRHVEISQAHHETFSWIFESSPRSGGCPRHTFLQWLQHGTGLYWINGKAGSGKSTLMKYIFESKKTRDILQNWAQGSNVEMGGFFFWNSGTSEQKSHTGLLRSLLHQALERNLELVSQVFPSEWASISLAMNRKESFDSLEWSLPSLKSAFQRWSRFLPTSTKVCFFIDGLDEYEGDHEEMAEFFKTVATPISHIKFCISSRPWHVFYELFDGIPGLRLQDLTYLDIKAYVHDKLKSHRRMQALAISELAASEELIDEIVAKASGVFLWVIIVVKSLLGGLLNRDSIEDLRRRLYVLPSDLDALYSHMLCHVDVIYQEQTARTFTVFRMLSVERDNRSRVVTALELALSTTASFPHMMSEASFPMDPSEIKAKCDWLDIHLKTRCAGLLEIYDSKFLEATGQLERFSNYSESPPRVGLLHSTVKEFLQTDKLSSFFLQVLKNADPCLSILMSFIIGLKRSILLSENGWILPLCNSNIWMTVTKALLVASSSVSRWTPEHSALIDELDRTAFRMWDLNEDPWLSGYLLHFHRDPGDNWDSCDKQRRWHRNFLGLVVMQGLAPYIEHRARTDSWLFTERQDTPLLLYVVHPDHAPESQLGNLPDTMYTLLKLGADPNQRWGNATPWEHMLTYLHHTGLDEDILEEWGYAFEIMLEMGADTEGECAKSNEDLPYVQIRASRHSVDLVITEVFSEKIPESEIAKMILDGNLFDDGTIPPKKLSETGMTLQEKLSTLRLSRSRSSLAHRITGLEAPHSKNVLPIRSPRKFQPRLKRAIQESIREGSIETKRRRAAGFRSFETHYLEQKRQKTNMFSQNFSYLPPCRNPLFQDDTPSSALDPFYATTTYTTDGSHRRDCERYERDRRAHRQRWGL
jgi:hypothetical protein